MLEFYKNNMADLKDTIEGYKKDIKLLEDEYKQEVINVKAEQQNLLEKQIQGNTDMLNNLHLIELQKKDLEIQKLNNALEQLQHNPKKRTSKTEV
jgi:Na+-transporting NADH:ubiquinone oxidoreductase subunit NqrA